MPQSRKRKKGTKKSPQKNPKKKQYKPYEVVKQNLYSFPNPIVEELTFEERKGYFLKIAKEAGEEFEKQYEELMLYFKEYDAMYLCSVCLLYFMAGPEGIDREAIDGKLDFHPFMLEVLQCLALFQPNTISAKPLQNEVNSFKKLLIGLNNNLSLSYFSLNEKAENLDDISRFSLRMEMMMHTLAVRNWAYEHQMKEVALDLASIIGERFITSKGYDPVTLLNLLFDLNEITNDRITSHIVKMHPMLKAKNYNDVFNHYETAFPHVRRTSAIERENMWKHFGKNLRRLQSIMMQHADLVLRDLLTFTVEDIQSVSKTAIDRDLTVEIFDALSFGFADLEGSDKNHIFLNNPVHQKPFIKLDDGSYFSAITFLFPHLGMDILENALNTDLKLKNQYAAEKGKYLEDKLEKLFRDAFPGSEIFSGSMWKGSDSDRLYENDLLVIIDDFALIVEAKSGTVSPPAKRGAPDRLFGTLKYLVEAPSNQAIRFEKFLKDNKKIHNFKTKSGKKNVVDATKIRYYVPLGVTLSNLGSIGCNLKKLIEAGVINSGLNELAPSISITDLEIIFELLPMQAEKIHYLSRRREFEAHVSFQGDELDLFSFYLGTGFNIGITEYDNSMWMNLTLKSKELDPYIIGKSRGVTLPKPVLEKSPYWEDILRSLEESKRPMWLQSSFILLNVAKEDQQMFEKKLNELKSNIKHGSMPLKHNYMRMLSGPERRCYAIVGYPYINIKQQERNNLLQDIIDKESEKLRGTVILGYDLVWEDHPYTMVAGNLGTDLQDNLEL
ncbi:hypothetical protein J2Y38_002118 [Flavobacterium sp. 2755]|uniref:hypothetical protein n=1 Tax=Flavobacterium sp. 2755 TaxID=2817765 RepID=UPI002858FA71|nr:hypothetical protein [Flavobacterium sp. 2755]MDR6761909.1 hypothetical protein [Flavobacterium sp. 2755]